MKVCKTCGQLNTNDSDFCCNCGKQGFVFQEEVTCPACGGANDKSFAFCINCGAQLPKVELPAEGYVAAPIDLQQSGQVQQGHQETANCSACGAEVPISAIYCNKCGASVAKLHAHRVVLRKICPHCGSANDVQAKYCAYCFFSLANADTKEMEVVHAEKAIEGEVLQQAYLQEGAVRRKICGGCGTLNPESEVFCVSCGLKLDSEKQKKYCPNCGAENDADVAFCTRCQWSFSGIFPDIVQGWTCHHCSNINSAANNFCVVCGAPKNKGRKT